MAKKKGLGRGLDALFADVAPINEDDYGFSDNDDSHAEQSNDINEMKAGKKSAKKSKLNEDKEEQEKNTDYVLYIDINDIKPNRAQPRKNFDEGKLNDLASSIKNNGVIQPLIVRESDGGYELVAGERRWRASRLAGLRKVPCIIRNFDNRQNAIVAIIENMQREDLNPIEEAIGLKSMTEKYGFTQEQVSESLGRSRTYIANSIRLLKLPDEICDYISTGKISAAHGRTIINISDKNKQMDIANSIIKEDLSVRATEKLANKAKDEIKPERKKRKTRKINDEKNAEIRLVEQELSSILETKVSITGSENKGKVEIGYYSLEDLNRLIDLLRASK